MIPDYDRDRVYLSDIKKLASWYGIVSKYHPYVEASEAPEAAAPETAPVAETEAADGSTEAPKAKTSRKLPKPAPSPAPMSP